jgi:predicted RNA-binding protein associated with RNAse of E/G family
MPQVEIHYQRPPQRLDIFVQQLAVDRPDCKITLHEKTPLAQPIYVGDSLVYEPGAPIVWFVFPGAWHDVGRFHLHDGRFTGYYINLIAPVEIEGRLWRMYDLCLDIWITPDGAFQVLDRDEFDEAVDRGWIDAASAARARTELDRMLAQLREARWPPEIIRTHDLAAVRRLVEAAEH